MTCFVVPFQKSYKIVPVLLYLSRKIVKQFLFCFTNLPSRKVTKQYLICCAFLAKFQNSTCFVEPFSQNLKLLPVFCTFLEKLQYSTCFCCTFLAKSLKQFPVLMNLSRKIVKQYLFSCTFLKKLQNSICIVTIFLNSHKIIPVMLYLSRRIMMVSKKIRQFTRKQYLFGFKNVEKQQ